MCLTEVLCLIVTSTGKPEDDDTTQKLSGNGKSLHILMGISIGIVTTLK